MFIESIEESSTLTLAPRGKMASEVNVGPSVGSGGYSII